LYLTKRNETYCDDSLANETHKKCIKIQYEKYFCPRVFDEGDIILVYDQDHDKLGAGKLEPMWHDPYIVKTSTTKGCL
jgi:hypothetical protein